MWKWGVVAALGGHAALATAKAAEGPAARGPGPNQTPCEWLLAARERGAPVKRQVKMATRHQDRFTASDIRCLKRAEVEKRVWKAARGPSVLEQIGDAVEVAVVEGLELAVEAAENAQEVAQTTKLPPVDIWVYIANPTELAERERGETMVAVGEFLSSVGLYDDVMGYESVTEQVFVEAAGQVADGLRAEGVQSQVVHGSYDLRGVYAKGCANGAWLEGRHLRRGEYALRVTVVDPVAVARTRKSDLEVGLGLQLGMDVAGMVKEEAALALCHKLRDQGVAALILPY